MNFTRNKFLKLDYHHQQKICSELLKKIYEKKLAKNSFADLIPHYNQLIHWLGIEELSNLSFQEISNRYHYHLKLGKINLKEHNLLPSLRTKDSTAKEEFGDVIIYLDNLRSAYNVGSIIRTTEALRLGTIHFSKNTPDTSNEKVEKTSMGTSSIIPCVKNSSLNNLTPPIIVLDTSDNAIKYDEFIFPFSKFSIVLGNEEYGVSQEILNLADYIIEIPMLGVKNSINVACAFAIIAAEIKRQKQFILEN